MLPRDAPSEPSREPEKIGASCCASGLTVPPVGDSHPQRPLRSSTSAGQVSLQPARSSALASSITSHVTEGCRVDVGGGGKRGRPDPACPVPPGAGGFCTPEQWEHRAQPGGWGAGLLPKQKAARFSWPHGPFSCQQERALRTHPDPGLPPEPPWRAAPRPLPLHCSCCCCPEAPPEAPVHPAATPGPSPALCSGTVASHV